MQKLCYLLTLFALAISPQITRAQSTDDNFTFAEAVSQYQGYYYNSKYGYVDANGNIQKGRQIAEHQTSRGKFRYISGGNYNALTCSGFVVPVLCRFLYGRSSWASQLNSHWRNYQLAGADIATQFNLKLSATLTNAQVTSSAQIQALIDAGTLNADAYYFFTVSDAAGGHVGFIQVKSGGELKTFQYSDMNVRQLPANQKTDPTDETYDMAQYQLDSTGTLLDKNGQIVTPVPVRASNGMLPLTRAPHTSRPGYYEGPFLPWYSGAHYGRSQASVALYELTPPLKARVIYTWSSQSRDLDIGVFFLGTSMGWSHPNSSSYMTWTGDDTSAAGSETVTVDLQKALDDHQITAGTPVTIDLAAGWYSPAGGSGPANLKTQLMRQDTVLVERQRVISPGTQRSAATTPVGTLSVSIAQRTMTLQ